MAQDTPVVQNKGMLGVAAVLGVAVVVLYNLQVAAIRAESRGDQVLILRFEQDMLPGQRIDVDKDLSVQEFPKRVADQIGDIIQERRPEDIKKYRGERVYRAVQRGQFLAASMLITTGEPLPSQRLTDGCVGKPVPISLAPGNILRWGDRVNLFARVPTRDGRFSVERVVEDVKVVAVGGKGWTDSPGNPRAEEESPVTYRNITIELTPQASLDLEKVLAYVPGGLGVELVKPTAERSPQAGQVKPGVLQMLEGGPAPSPRGGGTGPLP